MIGIISTASKTRLENFIINTQKGNSDFIRFVRYQPSISEKDDEKEDVIVMDVEYIDNEYRLCIDDTRSKLINNKEKIYYAGSFQSIKTQSILSDQQIMVYLEDLLGTTIPLIIYRENS